VHEGIDEMPGSAADLDTEIVCRLLLSVGEELGRLALEDPDFPPERLMANTWALLDRLPVPIGAEIPDGED
jgi:hypothetical protein